MPHLGKSHFSQFVSRECPRLLRFDLYDKDNHLERLTNRDGTAIPNPPPERLPNTLGRRVLALAGHERENQCYDELTAFFGHQVVRPAAGSVETLSLEGIIQRAEAGMFLIEAQYPIPQGYLETMDREGRVRTALANRPDPQFLAFDRARPDIIQVMAPEHWRRIQGSVQKIRRIAPTGEVFEIGADDLRLGLRVIDCKLAGSASKSHFAEIAYYGMTLAYWLEQTKVDGKPLAERFYVRSDSAIWPGTQGKSALVRHQQRAETSGLEPAVEDYLAALEEDLEFFPAEAFLHRLRRFFGQTLPEVLKPEDWRTLDWQVGEHCLGCDFLGFSWAGAGERGYWKVAAAGEGGQSCHCAVQAQREDNLSQLVGVTHGARKMLAHQQVSQVGALSKVLPDDPLFDSHQGLGAQRALISQRARLIGSGTAALVRESGSSAAVPRSVDIKITLVAEYDPGSTMTLALAWHVHCCAEKLTKEERNSLSTPKARVVFAETKDLACEAKILLEMLTDIYDGLQKVLAFDWSRKGRKIRDVTLQAYVWDQATHEHFRQVIGRHLGLLAEQDMMRHLCWLFPPDNVVQDASSVFMRSPVCVVGTPVRSLLAADIPFHYNIFRVAMLYNADNAGEETYYVNPEFNDPLSDHVPAERIHDFWDPESPEAFARNKTILDDTLRRKIAAIYTIAKRLVQDLSDTLVARAPSVEAIMGANQRGRADYGLCSDALVWLEHARLQKAATEFEVENIRAMQPREREAKFKSIRVVRLLPDQERIEALESLGIADAPHRLVFDVGPGSRDAKIKTSEFAWSLMPEDKLPLQHATLDFLSRESSVPPGLRMALDGLDSRRRYRKLMDACQVSVVAFSRMHGWIVLDPDDYNKVAGVPFLTLALREGWFAFASDPGTAGQGVVDPLAREFFVERLQKALQAIGNPPLARDRPLLNVSKVLELLKRQPGARGPKPTPPTPADDFLWNADAMAQEPAFGGLFTRAPGDLLETIGYHGLSGQQKNALRQALGKRLSLLWGPPGTGKSHTARSLLALLLALADRRGIPIRILISGPTWTAIDNVAVGLPGALATLGLEKRVVFRRLRSSSSEKDSVPKELQPYGCPTDYKHPDFQRLADRLGGAEGLTVVAATPVQVAKLVAQGRPRDDLARREMFDFLLIDEASQMDVGNAVLLFASLAFDAAVTVVGDHLQMPPIHPVPPPEGFESLVGSVYGFFRHYRGGHGIEPVMLDINRRSNQEIVEFVQTAGYGPEFKSAFPKQRMKLVGRLPTGAKAPALWPAHLAWTREWSAILDPRAPVVAVIHDDQVSSQKNLGEAHAAACLVTALWGRLAGLEGGPGPADGAPMDLRSFLTEGVGVVTPHRAQQSAVIEWLEKSLPRDPGFEFLYEAVDTVERFQGQQRVAMIASLGLGDRDQIRSEEEFLFSLNRFNVVASRARAKLILLISQSLIDHLPSDLDIMRQSGFIKHFCDGFLTHEKEIALPRFDSASRIVLKTR